MKDPTILQEENAEKIMIEEGIELNEDPKVKTS